MISFVLRLWAAHLRHTTQVSTSTKIYKHRGQWCDPNQHHTSCVILGHCNGSNNKGEREGNKNKRKHKNEKNWDLQAVFYRNQGIKEIAFLLFCELIKMGVGCYLHCLISIVHYGAGTEKWGEERLNDSVNCTLCWCHTILFSTSIYSNIIYCLALGNTKELQVSKWRGQ